MTEQKKPAPAPKAWRGKPRPGYEHYGELKPIAHESRPNLLMRLGSRLFEKMTGK